MHSAQIPMYGTRERPLPNAARVVGIVTEWGGIALLSPKPVAEDIADTPENRAYVVVSTLVEVVVERLQWVGISAQVIAVDGAPTICCIVDLARWNPEEICRSVVEQHFSDHSDRMDLSDKHS